MNEAVLELLDPGLGVSFQDLGRHGWRRFGVPPGGALDDHASRWANRLLGNPLSVPVLEVLLHGAQWRALRRIEVSIAGASVPEDPAHPGRWHTRSLEEGDRFGLPPSAAGVWSYVGVRGGFVADRWFGSVSTFPRGGLGEPLSAGAVLYRRAQAWPSWPSGVGQRWLDPAEQRDYSNPPSLPVWPGPQWDLFPKAAQDALFGTEWRVSSRCDRTGYRLDGDSIPVPPEPMLSEPVLPGSLQVPPDGHPIVTLRDGPTVGGYPKIALIDPRFLAWLVQCRTGQSVRFVPVRDAPVA